MGGNCVGEYVVMLLSNAFISDPRVEKEANALIDVGYDVVVVAWNRSGDASASETRGRIRIERVGPPAVHGGGASNIGAYRQFWREAANKAKEFEPYAVHCHDADTIPAGRKACRELAAKGGEGSNLVVDYHELYRDSKMVPRKGMVGRLARAFVGVVERSGTAEARLVIVANPGTAEYYSKLAGGRKVVMVENAPDAEMFSPLPETGEPGFRVCFIGQKRYVGSLDVLMKAVQSLPEVSAYLAGGGVDAEEVERLARGYERVTTAGRLTYEEIPSHYLGCHAVYAVNDVSVGNMRVNFPVKAMEGMALGLPVIVSKGTWIGDYVEEHGIGLAVDGEAPASVAQAILTLRDDRKRAREMGRKGRAIVEDGLNWRAAAHRLVQAYESLG